MVYETNITSLGLDLIDNPAEPLSKSQTKLSTNIQLINDELESKASKLELNLLSSSVSQSLISLSDYLDTSMETLDSKTAEALAETLAEIQHTISTALTNINTKLAQAEGKVAAAVETTELLVPPQTGQKGKVLTTNGVNTEWKDASLS